MLRNSKSEAERRWPSFRTMERNWICACWSPNSSPPFCPSIPSSPPAQQVNFSYNDTTTLHPTPFLIQHKCALSQPHNTHLYNTHKPHAHTQHFSLGTPTITKYTPTHNNTTQYTHNTTTQQHTTQHTTHSFTPFIRKLVEAVHISRLSTPSSLSTAYSRRTGGEDSVLRERALRRRRADCPCCAMGTLQQRHLLDRPHATSPP